MYRRRLSPLPGPLCYVNIDQSRSHVQAGGIGDGLGLPGGDVGGDPGDLAAGDGHVATLLIPFLGSMTWPPLSNRS